MFKSKFSDISDEKLSETFMPLANETNAPDDLYKIFHIGLKDKSLFPQIRLGLHIDNYQKYLEKWIKLYMDAHNNPPSSRIATPKGTPSDPAIKSIVQTATGASDEEATQQETHHILFMSAENIQGNLLEEYIDSVLKNYGWLWCKGNVLRAIDFCTPDGKVLLQIKNKFNTENSSSAFIRSGTNIIKWYRLGRRKVNGIFLPQYKWDSLNEIVKSYCDLDIYLSEDDYQDFLQKIVKKNPKIITDK